MAEASIDQDGTKTIDVDEGAADQVPKADYLIESPGKTAAAEAEAAVDRSESAMLLLDSVTSDCLGGGVNHYEKLPRLNSRSTEERSGGSSPEKSSESNKKFLGRFFDSNKKKEKEEQYNLGGGDSQCQHKLEEKDKDKVEDEKESDQKKREKEKNKKKKRSSWLPDPEKRWPIQGWY